MDKNYSALDIRKKHHISQKEYLRLQEKIVEETGFKRIGGPSVFNKPMMHIRPTRYGGYSIEKCIDGKRHYCGTYSTLECAKKIRDKLVEYNWRKDVIVFMRERYSTASKGNV